MELTKRKENLLKHIKEGQKLIFKGCYSRPLYVFNRKQAMYNAEHDDFLFLQEGAKKEKQRVVVNELRKKIEALEFVVKDDHETERFLKLNEYIEDDISNIDGTSNAGASSIGF